MKTKKRAGRFGELTLLAVSRFSFEDATGVNIWHKLEELDNDRVATGSVYRTLKDLELKGLLTSKEMPIANNGTRTHYQITDTGIGYLEKYQAKISVIYSELNEALVA